MITADLNTDNCTGNILMEPNRPISWQENMRFIKVFALLSLIIGGVFMYRGFLLVMPYSSLEILLIFLALYLAYKHASTCQIIYFTEDSVIIESGNLNADKHIEYQRYWSEFHVDNNGSYNIPRLSIRSKGKTTEIGEFLNRDDKIKLIKLIKELTACFQKQARVK